MVRFAPGRTTPLFAGPFRVSRRNRVCRAHPRQVARRPGARSDRQSQKCISYPRRLKICTAGRLLACTRLRARVCP
jgi:hypothetical protein